METESVAPKRILSFDFFRAYGCLAVVLLHVLTGWTDVSEGGFFYYQNINFMIFNAVLIPLLTRIAVPIFFMMSGALFLDPVRNISLKKHIVKIVVLLSFFGYFMCLIELIAANKVWSFKFLYIGILNLLQEKSWAHLWYLYATIGLYLITPFFRSYIKCATRKQLNTVLIGLIILFSIIPTINHYFGLELTSFGLATSRSSIVYYFSGYYFSKFNERVLKNKKIFIGALLISAVVIAIEDINVYNVKAASFTSPTNFWIFVYSISLFVLLCNSKFIENLASKKYITFLSSLSLGIYIIHTVFINALYKGLHIYPAKIYFHPVFGEFIIWVGVSCLSIVSVMIMKRIPILKKYV